LALSAFLTFVVAFGLILTIVFYQCVKIYILGQPFAGSFYISDNRQSITLINKQPASGRILNEIDWQRD